MTYMQPNYGGKQVIINKNITIIINNDIHKQNQVIFESQHMMPQQQQNMMSAGMMPMMTPPMMMMGPDGVPVMMNHMPQQQAQFMQQRHMQQNVSNTFLILYVLKITYFKLHIFPDGDRRKYDDATATEYCLRPTF